MENVSEIVKQDNIEYSYKNISCPVCELGGQYTVMKYDYFTGALVCELHGEFFRDSKNNLVKLRVNE